MRVAQVSRATAPSAALPSSRVAHATAGACALPESAPRPQWPTPQLALVPCPSLRRAHTATGERARGEVYARGREGDARGGDCRESRREGRQGQGQAG
eukprot:1305629-Prymnesium_polylepis.1